MTRRMLRGALLAAAFGGAACHREASPPPAAKAAPAATAPAASAPPPGVGMDGVSKPLLQLLEDEKTHRPSGTPSADALFDALEKSGVAMQGRAQVVGRMLGAAFCENAHTPQGIVLSACEFTDASALAKGRAYSEKTFAKALPNRILLVNKNTLLTINPPDESAPVGPQIDAIKKTFAAL